MDNKKTALNSLHKKYGAKLVSFAGYEMPIQYHSGIIEEHKNTRDNAGIFDVSHMGQLFIEGDDTLAKNLEKIFPYNSVSSDSLIISTTCTFGYFALPNLSFKCMYSYLPLR